MLRCVRCGNEHPATPEFWVVQKSGKLVRRCRNCDADRNRKYLERTHGEAAKRVRKRKQSQAGRAPGPACEICGHEYDFQSSKSKPNYDHEHESNEFRGWICGWCNVALGMLGDSPEIARACAEYLEKRGCRRWRKIVIR